MASNLAHFTVTTNNPWFAGRDDDGYAIGTFAHATFHACEHRIGGAACGERDTDGCMYEYTITNDLTGKSVTWTAWELSHPKECARCPWDADEHGSYHRRAVLLDIAEALGCAFDEFDIPDDDIKG